MTYKHHPFFVSSLAIVVVAVLLTGFGFRFGAAATSASSLTTASRRERKVQANFVAHSCNRDQCYINLLGGCFHNTSHECQNLIHASLPDAPAIANPQQIPSPRPISISRPSPRPTQWPTQRPTPIPTTRPTQNPTPRPVTPRQTRRPTLRPTQRPTPRPTKRPTTRPVTQTQIFEIPILVRLLNVEEDYILTASDRTRYLDIVKWVLDRTLDDPWEILRLEYVGDYFEERRRRLQSSLLRGRDSDRRLYKTIYLPVLVTLRGEGDSSDIARIITFILQILRNNLSILLARFKSLNSNAFRNLQLIVEELNLANIAGSSGSGTTNINGQGTQPINTIILNATTSTNTSEETTKTTSSDGVAPFWVWLIVAIVFICICIVIFVCMSRKRSDKSRDGVTKDEYLNHLAVLYGYGRQKAEDDNKRRIAMKDRRRRSRSEREGAGRRKSDKRSGYYKPKRHRRIRRNSNGGDGYISSGDVDIDMNRLGGRRRSSSSRLLLMDQERVLVAPLPHPHQPSRRASFCATTATTTATRPPRRASFNDAISTKVSRKANCYYSLNSGGGGRIVLMMIILRRSRRRMSSKLCRITSSPTAAVIDDNNSRAVRRDCWIKSSVARQCDVSGAERHCIITTEAKPTELMEDIIASEPEAKEQLIIVLLVVILLVLTAVVVILFDSLKFAKFWDNFGRAGQNLHPSRLEHFPKRSIFRLNNTTNR